MRKCGHTTDRRELDVVTFMPVNIMTQGTRVDRERRNVAAGSLHTGGDVT